MYISSERTSSASSTLCAFHKAENNFGAKTFSMLVQFYRPTGTRKYSNILNKFSLLLSTVPPNTASSLTAPPQTAANVQVICFFFVIYDSLTAVFQYRRFSPDPRAVVLGGGGVDCIYKSSELLTCNLGKKQHKLVLTC